VRPALLGSASGCSWMVERVTRAGTAARSSAPLARQNCDAVPQPWRLPTAAGIQSGWRLGEDGGEPWLVLHGGPGGGASPVLLAPFDGTLYAAWAPHQRGTDAAGWHRARRLPVAALVSDLEALRIALAIPRWSVFGGSWGAYLALAYLRRYPASVQRLVLRGSFLGGTADVWNLIRRMPKATMQQAGLPLPMSRNALPVWLARAQKLFRFGKPGSATALVARAWLLAERRAATRAERVELACTWVIGLQLRRLRRPGTCETRGATYGVASAMPGLHCECGDSCRLRKNARWRCRRVSWRAAATAC